MAEFQNCSHCDECDSLLTFQFSGLLEILVTKLCEMVFISSIMIIVLYLIDIMVFDNLELKKLTSAESQKPQRLIQIICLSLLMLTLPLITLMITAVLLYKVICSIAIRRKDRRFVKFLDSFDVFYSLEDKTRDIQGIIRSNTIELAAEKVKEKLRNVFTNYGSDKIFYRRNEEYGFYYWRKYSFIDLAQYVQIKDDAQNTEVTTTFDNNDHTIAIVDGANEIIVPYNDEGLFKVLIMKDNHRENNEDEYKITLKFHHSIKDVALIEFVARLVETADDWRITLVPNPELQDSESPDALIKMIRKLCGILVRSFDNIKLNNCHSQNDYFARMKGLKWTKSDENFVCKVKDVRDNVHDFSLSQILEGAFTTVLRKLER